MELATSAFVFPGCKLNIKIVSNEIIRCKTLFNTITLGKAQGTFFLGIQQRLS